MTLKLRQMRPAVMEIELLIATRRAVDHARKLGGAPEADFGEEIDDVIHRIGRQQLAMRAAMAGLATTISLRLVLLRAATGTARASAFCPLSPAGRPTAASILEHDRIAASIPPSG